MNIGDSSNPAIKTSFPLHFQEIEVQQSRKAKGQAQEAKG